MRRPDAPRSWLTAYGAATSTDTTYSNILEAATPGEEDKPDRATVDAYREHLARIFVLDSIPAWIRCSIHSSGSLTPPSTTWSTQRWRHAWDIRHLNWLPERIGDRLADRVLITTGEYACRRARASPSCHLPSSSRRGAPR